MRKSFGLLLIALLVFADGCKKDSNNTKTDTCHNGIKDGDEEAIDCGGSCTACVPLCTGYTSGTLASTWFPLKKGNSWTYTNTTFGTMSIVSDSIVANGHTYFMSDFNASWYRYDTNGDIYFNIGYNGGPYADNLFLPANPTVGQLWTYQPGYLDIKKRKVLSITDSVKTSSCTYHNCLRIQELNSHDGQVSNYYYAKGVGWVGGDGTVLTAVTFK